MCLLSATLAEQLQSLDEHIHPTTFAKRYIIHHIANDYWPVIGKGASRTVYGVSDTLVLKIDIHGGQNFVEANPEIQKNARAAIASTLLVGRSYRWLLTERVNTGKDAQPIIYEMFGRRIVDTALAGCSTRYGAAWDDAIRYLFHSKYALSKGEALYHSQWGLKGKTPVLVDLGINENGDDTRYTQYVR